MSRIDTHEFCPICGCQVLVKDEDEKTKSVFDQILKCSETSCEFEGTLKFTYTFQTEYHENGIFKLRFMKFPVNHVYQK